MKAELVGVFNSLLLLLLPSVLWRCWLGGTNGIRPVKSWVVGYWHSCLSGARCRPAYGPADATAALSLASVKSRLVLLFWYWLTWVVPDKGPLNLCVCCRFSDEEKTEEKEGRQRQGSWVSSECELLVIWGAEWQMWWKLSHNNYEYQFSEKKINCVCKLIKSFVLCCDFSQETDAANSEMVCYVNSFFVWLSESIFHLANRFTVSCTSQVEINQPFHISCNRRLLNNYVSRHVVFIMLCDVLFV